MARGRKIRVGTTVRTIPADKTARFDEIDHTLRELYAGPDRAHEYQAAIDAAATYLIDAPEPPTPWAVRAASRGNAATAETVDTWTAQLDTILAPHAHHLANARAALDAATAAARTLATLVTDDGLTETATAQRLGIDRLTVRKWRGKKDRDHGDPQVPAGR
jgi:hypothetical protein